MKAQGGKTIYGVVVGILMLETRFPRIVGDMGNAATWPFPVFYRTVKGATPDLVVRKGAIGRLIQSTAPRASCGANNTPSRWP